MRRTLMILALLLGATIGFTATADAASPAVNPNFVREQAAAPDVGIQASFYDYGQTVGYCYSNGQRSRSWLNLWYNDGSVYYVRITQQLQYKNSRGRWVTAKTGSKTRYAYGGTGYMSINKFFRWSNRTLRTRDTRVRTVYRLYYYGGGYAQKTTASNYCT